jgi:hypothetical protein
VANAEKRFERLASAAWRASNGTVNYGGCAGFAGVVGACARAVRAPCRTFPVVVRGEEVDWRREWARSPGPRALSNSWHIVSAVTLRGREYVVDAEYGPLEVPEFRRRWNIGSLLTLDDVHATPRQAWLAYKHAAWWNTDFPRETMADIVRAAWGIFRPLHRVRSSRAGSINRR